ncbi:MAG: o-succinylbenzoate--CoA ligase [Verrucomicrobia bacterium]|nr:o-succinylbenzoate--CoA ligase [Verrucomicrobiota bacterium]
MAEIACPLREAGQISGERTALLQGGTELHYDELDLMVSSTARRLQIAGCEQGERVAILMPNNWQQIVLILALFRVRAVAAPLSIRLPAAAIRKCIDQIGGTKLIAHVEGDGVKALEGIDIFLPRDLVDTQFGAGHAGLSPRINLQQPATVIFTSGSTGSSKGVLHTFGNHYYNAHGVNLNFQLRSGDSWMISLPLYHVGGLSILFRCVTSGATIILPGRDEDLAEAIKRTQPTYISLVTAQFQRLLRDSSTIDDMKKMKSILLGGGSVPDSLLQESAALGLRAHTTYGLTEMASQVTTMLPSEKGGGHGAGHLLKHRDMKIQGDGEILVRGQTLFSGYVAGDNLDLPVDEEGWFHTGDLGRLDESDSLYVTGRKDNMFISGGENIHPEIIEGKLMGIGGVAEAIVVPVADDEFGSRPVAFVRCEAEWNPEVWSKLLEEELPRFMLPVRYIEWPGDSGDLKVSRVSLRNLAG